MPRAKIPHFEKLPSGRQIPTEFKMQILASEACQGVVKVRFLKFLGAKIHYLFSSHFTDPFKNGSI